MDWGLLAAEERRQWETPSKGLAFRKREMFWNCKEAMVAQHREYTELVT